MATRRSKRSHSPAAPPPSSSSSSSQAKTAVVVVVPPRGSSMATTATAAATTKKAWQAKLEQLAGHLASASSSSSPSSPSSGSQGRLWGSGALPDGDDVASADPSPFGSVFSTIQEWKETDDAWSGRMTALAEAGQGMRSQVEKELTALTIALEERSEHNYRLQLRIAELRAGHMSAAQHLEGELHSESSRRRLELSQLEMELDRIQREARETFREQEETIPRLQHVIALYAACTGIKWYDDDHEEGGEDDDDDDGDPVERRSRAATRTPHDTSRRAVWRGVVAVPALHQLKEFTFDASKRFDSANALWGTITGKAP